MTSENIKLRAAVIGLGVGERHIDGYNADSRCSVVAICDTDPVKLKDVQTRYSEPYGSCDPDEILQNPDIDVISIASYDGAHRDQIIKALESGKHVFVEKPLCLHDEEFEDIASTYKSNQTLKLSSNLILRKSPRFMSLRERILGNELGTPYYVEGDYNYGRLHKITDGWRGEAPYYSVVHGGSIHLIDLIMWMTGHKVTEVTAMGTNIATRDSQFKFDDTIAALLRFDGGMIGKITSNFPSMVPHTHNLAVYGTTEAFIQNHNGDAAYYQSRDPDAKPKPDHEAYPGTAKGDMIPQFVSSILDGGEPEVTAQEVFDAMAVSLAIEESNKTSKPVEVKYL